MVGNDALKKSQDQVIDIIKTKLAEQAIPVPEFPDSPERPETDSRSESPAKTSDPAVLSDREKKTLKKKDNTAKLKAKEEKEKKKAEAKKRREEAKAKAKEEKEKAKEEYKKRIQQAKDGLVDVEKDINLVTAEAGIIATKTPFLTASLAVLQAKEKRFLVKNNPAYIVAKNTATGATGPVVNSAGIASDTADYLVEYEEIREKKNDLLNQANELALTIYNGEQVLKKYEGVAKLDSSVSSYYTITQEIYRMAKEAINLVGGEVIG